MGCNAVPRQGKTRQFKRYGAFCPAIRTTYLRFGYAQVSAAEHSGELSSQQRLGGGPVTSLHASTLHTARTVACYQRREAKDGTDDVLRAPTYHGRRMPQGLENANTEAGR